MKNIYLIILLFGAYFIADAQSNKFTPKELFIHNANIVKTKEQLKDMLIIGRQLYPVWDDYCLKVNISEAEAEQKGIDEKYYLYIKKVVDVLNNYYNSLTKDFAKETFAKSFKNKFPKQFEGYFVYNYYVINNSDVSANPIDRILREMEYDSGYYNEFMNNITQPESLNEEISSYTENQIKITTCLFFPAGMLSAEKNHKKVRAKLIKQLNE